MPVAVPYGNIAVPVGKPVKHPLNICFLKSARQFLVIRHAGKTESFQKREIPVPGIVFVLRAVIPKARIAVRQHPAVKSHQCGNNLKGRTGRKTGIRQAGIPVSKNLSDRRNFKQKDMARGHRQIRRKWNLPYFRTPATAETYCRHDSKQRKYHPETTVHPDFLSFFFAGMKIYSPIRKKQPAQTQKTRYSIPVPGRGVSLPQKYYDNRRRRSTDSEQAHPMPDIQLPALNSPFLSEKPDFHKKCS